MEKGMGPTPEQDPDVEVVRWVPEGHLVVSFDLRSS
jgi:hypothetical protein